MEQFLITLTQIGILSVINLRRHSGCKDRHHGWKLYGQRV